MKTWSPVLAALLALAASSPAFAAHHASKGPSVSFPMKPDEYRKLSEARLARILAVIDKKLDRGTVSPERRKVIHRMFDDAAKDARAEVVKATADGSVTEAEASKVKALALQVRIGVRERMAAERKGKKWESSGATASGKEGKDAKGSKDKAPSKDAKASKDKSPSKDSKPAKDSKPTKGSKEARSAKQA
ncbi:MAG: hypothetical protein ABJE95_15635 [Byssovorax sp.]